jgi:hypothetical protein
MISGDLKTDMKVSASDQSRYTSRARRQSEIHPWIQGVKILGFRAESRAREAGMQEGDVIIEYDGAGNLTTGTLVGLTKMTKPEGTRSEWLLSETARVVQ